MPNPTEIKNNYEVLQESYSMLSLTLKIVDSIREKLQLHMNILFEIDQSYLSLMQELNIEPPESIINPV